jgi:site-specific DNA-methyltransferase (adenine-specific)
MSIDLIHGDCLEKMKNIEDKSIDFICTDPPYGTTACAWDSISNPF